MGFSDALRSRTFRALYIAETASILGDQLHRVALSILVFTETNSASATALTYALTFLPAIAGGALLSGLSDRIPRRVVLIGCDVVRAALVLLMIIPGTPLAILLLLLSVVIFINPAFTAAEVALLAAVLEGDRYRSAAGLRMMTNQLAQVAGFATRGGRGNGPGSALRMTIDAISYAISAVIIANGTRIAPGGLAAGPPVATKAALPQPIRLLFADRELLTLVGLTALAGFFIVPEGLAAPYVAGLGGGRGWIGTLMTTIPLGSVIGTLAVLRLVPPNRRERTTAVMAALTGVPLIACAASPGLLTSAVLWLVSGVLARVPDGCDDPSCPTHAGCAARPDDRDRQRRAPRRPGHRSVDLRIRRGAFGRRHVDRTRRCSRYPLALPLASSLSDGQSALKDDTRP